MKTRRFARTALLLLLLWFSMTATVYANAGLGLFFPGIIHLLLGNIVIGLIEAFFVQKVLKVKASYGVIIAGNYASTFVGYVIIAMGGVATGIEYTADVLKALSVLFAASVIIEWPFFAWAVKEKISDFPERAIKRTFHAQCVSYAILVPFYFLTPRLEGSGIPRSERVTGGIENLAAEAFQYRIRSDGAGGGGGSYDGFSIPASMSVTEFERYGAIVTKDSIVFVAMNVEGTKPLANVVLDSRGNLHSWEYTFDPVDVPFGEYVSSDLKKLADAAHEYRTRPIAQSGGGGSYDGFSAPNELSITRYRRYAATIFRDSIAIVAMHLHSTKAIVSVVLDSTGSLRSWKWKEMD